MKLYRIHTEKKDNIAGLCAEWFDGFTIIESKGYWQGKPEDSITIEVLTESKRNIAMLCNDLKLANNQVEVLQYAIEL